MMAKMPEKPARIARTVILAGLVTAVAVAVSAIATVNSPAWRAVRTAFRTTYGSPATYTQVVERRQGSRMRREEYRVFQDERRRKVVQTAPAQFAGLTMFWDHPKEMAFAPGFPLALNSSASHRPRPMPPGPPWFPLHRRSRLVLGRETVPGGGDGQTVTAYAGSAIRVKLWIDRRTGFILRQERYDRRGEAFDVTVNRDIVNRPPGLEEALRVRLPHGARVISDPRRWRGDFSLFVLKKEAPFPFLVPHRPPAGYRLVHAEVLSAADKKLIALRFARGRSGFTLFEYPGRDPLAAVPSEAIAVLTPPGREGDRIFRTVHSGIAAVAVGRLSADEAKELFSLWERITPSPEQEKAD